LRQHDLFNQTFTALHSRKIDSHIMSESFVPTRISVIMPCYNAAAFIEEAVNSVMRQTYADVELIVVDDGSTDGSVKILERIYSRHAPRVVLHFQSRMGPYPARNIGLRHARGGRIAFLDADDYWALDALEKLAAALDADHADIAYCGWQNVGEGAPGIEPFIPPDYDRMDTAAEFLRSCPWPIHAALVRREAIDAVQGFSERCFSAMDYDLWLRLYAHTQKLVRVPEVLAFYRWHDKGQISKTKWKQVLDALQVRRDFVAHHPERVAHLSETKVRELSDGFLLHEAYRAYWQRNLLDAQVLFRRSLTQGLWKSGDLRYLIPALLPGALFRGLVGLTDRVKEKRT
jgi:glycosyltransferase involved in cell wall biosynthesis